MTATGAGEVSGGSMLSCASNHPRKHMPQPRACVHRVVILDTHHTTPNMQVQKGGAVPSTASAAAPTLMPRGTPSTMPG
jgi:hypothetical protein